MPFNCLTIFSGRLVETQPFLAKLIPCSLTLVSAKLYRVLDMDLPPRHPLLFSLLLPTLDVVHRNRFNSVAARVAAELLLVVMQLGEVRGEVGASAIDGGCRIWLVTEMGGRATCGSRVGSGTVEAAGPLRGQ